jgi:hypothetical protein
MQFSSQTLRTTSRRFHRALKARGIELPFPAVFDVWAAIIIGKKYSRAIAQADADNYVWAQPISEESICAALRIRRREVDHRTAGDLFAEAIRDDLPMLSANMYQLVQLVAADDERCLIHVFGDPTGLGLMHAKYPGYLPVSQVGLAMTKQEVEWLKANASFAAHVMNSLSGISSNQHMNIFASSHRASARKSDEVFTEVFRQRIDTCSAALAKALLDEFDFADVEDWDPDFDDVRDIVYEVVDDIVRAERTEWLSAECNLAETMIDRLAVRLRETMKWMCHQANDDELESSPHETIARSAALSIRKLLGTDQAD